MIFLPWSKSKRYLTKLDPGVLPIGLEVRVVGEDEDKAAVVVNVDRYMSQVLIREREEYQWFDNSHLTVRSTVVQENLEKQQAIMLKRYEDAEKKLISAIRALSTVREEIDPELVPVAISLRESADAVGDAIDRLRSGNAQRPIVFLKGHVQGKLEAK